MLVFACLIAHFICTCILSSLEYASVIKTFSFFTSAHHLIMSCPAGRFIQELFRSWTRFKGERWNRNNLVFIFFSLAGERTATY